VSYTYLQCSSAAAAVNYHNAVVNEASSITRRLQMWILLGTGDPHVPHLSPCLVQVAMYWVDAGMMRCHCVAHVHWDVM